MARRRRLNPSLITGLLLVLLMTGFTALGLVFTPHDPSAMAVANRLAPPSRDHWMGTDQFGRDLFSRLLQGGRASLFVGATAVAAGFVIGVCLGGLAGYYRGLWDEGLMRLADGFYAFPILLLALLTVTLLGPGEITVLLAITVGNIPIFMRLTRSSFLSLRGQSFVEAARALGASDRWIIVRHMLPNAMPTLLVQASANLAAAILAEASLSYLGIGVQPPMPSWGRMLREAQTISGLAPWTVLFPGLAIALTVLGFNLLGDGLQKGRNRVVSIE